MSEAKFSEFLEDTPPGAEKIVTDFAQEFDQVAAVKPPPIRLYCENQHCSGQRIYNCHEKNHRAFLDRGTDLFLKFICRNCGASIKTFSIACRFQSPGKWSVTKYGERPGFGPPIPARAITLIGGERDLFLKGRRCENQGLGIGAFVYYRRVIESQKFRIFDEIIRVVEKVSPGDEILDELVRAKLETQFTTAVDAIKHALPQSLFINGYNPLTLLHSALSEGVHQHGDEECLSLASAVRTVLFELAERLGNALKEEAELTNAINKLANPRAGS